MKTVNLCAIVAVALTCYLGGLQNFATAQNGYAGPGDYNGTAAGQNIEIIPSWDLNEVENPPQSFYSPPVNPESYGNIPSYGPMPPYNDQRNSAYSENYRQAVASRSACKPIWASSPSKRPKSLFKLPSWLSRCW